MSEHPAPSEPCVCGCPSSRRNFLKQAAATAGAASMLAASSPADAAEKAKAIEAADGAHGPLGVAKGIHPGRVAWSFDPAAVSWEMKGKWWDDAYNNQAVIDRMLSQTVTCVAGEKTDAAAWDAIFHSFNRRLGRGDAGYAAGQKVAVKINMNNTTGHADNNNINASPHLVLALLRQLVQQAGVPQSAITVFDASRFVTDNVFNKCHAEFPEVVFADHVGGDGRAKVEYVENAIPYSVDNRLAKGLATCATEADYLINMAILKGHSGTGVTFCGKNYYGVTSIDSYWKNNKHDYFQWKGKPTYLTFTDYMGHKDLGGKTMLFLIDSLLGCAAVGGPPQPKWQSAPFNGHWPCSLFASEDGVAIDSVATDFFMAEFPSAPDIQNSEPYLHESALADNPPSGALYDPQRTGERLSSLGVHEHWNNPQDRQYSRNLSPDGKGIELIALRA